MMTSTDVGSANHRSSDMSVAGTEIIDAGLEEAGAEDLGIGSPGTSDTGVLDIGMEDADVTDFGVRDARVVEMDMSVDGGPMEPISFATVFTSVLEPKGCTAGYCHAGHAGGLLMDNMESAYENLVNVENSTMTMCDQAVRVVPGEPESSVLWLRVHPESDDCLTEDQKMPPFDEGLTEEEKQLIYDWILTGANP